MDKFHYIYIIINLINNKKYIGDRSCDCLPEKDPYLGSGINIKKAIKKYGKNNFKKEILEIFESREEAHKNEEKYINLYKTHISQNGYNIDPKGGLSSNSDFSRKKQSERGFKRKHSLKTIEKIRKSVTGMKLSEETKENMKKPKTEEAKKNMSLSSIGKPKSEKHKKNISNSKSGPNHPNWGKPLSEETKRKIRESFAKKGGLSLL